MIHYSCDRCGRSISKAESVRYVVRMEMEATLNTQHEDVVDNDQDCLLEMDQMLEALEQEMFHESEPVIHRRQTFDLCPSCFQKFVKNPVGRELVSPFGFSHN